MTMEEAKAAAISRVPVVITKCNRYDSEDKLHCQRILKLSILYKNDGTQEALAECLDRNRNAVYTANVSQLVAEGEKKND